MLILFFMFFIKKLIIDTCNIKQIVFNNEN